MEWLYNRLPIFLQNAACNGVGWRIQRTRFGSGFQRCLEEAVSRSQWPEDRLLEWRDEQLRAFVAHAATTVPYYRDLFKRERIDPRDIRTLDDMKRLPLLTKAMVQDAGASLQSEAVPKRQRMMAHTSGTTGGGLRFATTLEATQWQWATWWRFRRLHGLRMGVWCGYFGGRSVVPRGQQEPPYWRFNVPARQILFSSYHINDKTLGAYVDALRRWKPSWLHGYPSFLALVAAHVVDSRSDLGYQLKWVTTGAENLLRQQADLMEKAFGIRPLQHYGLAEGTANLSECPAGQLHVDEDFAAVEFVENAGGPGCRIVGTNFSNPATPLLRYDTNDLTTLCREPCTCGLPGRVVQCVDGRQEDYVVLPSGARIGRLDHIFKDMVHVREAQIYQKAVDEILLRVVRGLDFHTDDERLLLWETRQRVGDEVRLTIEYVDRLERSKSGKLRFVVSDLPRGHLTQPADKALGGG